VARALTQAIVRDNAVIRRLRHSNPVSAPVMASPVRSTDETAITEAAAALRVGRLVGLPTETVYGLAADATNPDALAAVFAAKGRPRFNPLICHVRDTEAAGELGVFSLLGTRLARAFWPGPLTLVLPRRPGGGVHDLATAGLSTIALRVPAHPVAQAVLRAFDGPIAAPSANVSGHVSPTRAEHVAEAFGDAVAFVLDGGPSAVGLESSVVAVDGERAVLLRLGGLTRGQIEAVAGPLQSAEQGGAVTSPGMLLKHYAPASPLRLNAEAAGPGEILIGFGPIGGERTLSSRGDLTEAAANLFAMLRAADAQGAVGIAVAPIPNEGLGEAINDRLTRAAAGR
jgi:L-threonylcarbamoyladenylate synthase